MVKTATNQNGESQNGYTETATIQNSDVMIDVIIIMGICMQNHKCNELENAFPITKVSRLVRVYTDSHHNGYKK